MRLTKDEFCAAVNKYEQMCAEENKVIEALGCNFEWKPSLWLSEYYELLIKMCDLPENDLYGTDLDYYCFELDFGKKWEPGTILIDDEDIPCRNAEELWNLIMFDEED